MHLSRPPLLRSYLVFLGLWAGEAPSGRDDADTLLRLRRFRHEGIDFFLDLTEDGELEPYAHLLHPWARHVRVPMPGGAAPAAARVREAIATVDRALGDGFFVYVHGAHGLERTGTVIGCWLAHWRHGGGDPVARVEELRTGVPGRLRRSPSTPAARALVRSWPPYAGGSSRRPSLRLVGSTEGGSR
jgi:hypothetical protein